MKFQFSKFDDKEHFLCIELNNNETKLNFDSKTISTINTNDFFELLNDYKKNSYASNVKYEDRKLLKKICTTIKDPIFIEYVRIFACSFFLLHFYEYENIENTICKRIQDEQFHVFDNHFYVDWTGFLGTQPSIYYISRNIIKDKNEDLGKLYSVGFLGKLEIESDIITDTFYFIPFKPKHIPKMLSLICGNTIKLIMKQREEKYEGINK
ncbi:hypothetical protein SAMN04487977_101604 [Treponema bryantii]|uniref:Uncharacterized protein n=1 Tax=Treponema bryantii TaxID=163 RepID=A0A1H9B7V8_9SPIR|nr:hypothetical protein [Treponema bryantii]SEP84905.1 hypothetical protein SAMN04487977_101604 [Treponema bryantii]